MARYVVLRLAFLPVAGLVVATLSFFLMTIGTGDVEELVLGNLATPQQLHDFRIQNGLDLALWDRYLRYLTDLAHGSLGVSYYNGAAIAQEIMLRLPSTLELVVLAFLVAWCLGVGLGALSAYYRGTPLDSAIRAFVSVKQAVPSFVVGLLGSLVFVYTFHLLPVPLGETSLAVTPPPHVTGAAFIDALLARQWVTAADAFVLMLLPAVTLGLGGAVPFARIVRATLSEALDAPHTQFARSRGVPERTLLWLALRSSILPAITYAGIVFAGLIGGNAIIETMFNWPGVGQWAIGSIFRADLPAAQGFVLLSGVTVALVYFVTDMLSLMLDPRIARPAPGGSGVAEAQSRTDETTERVTVAV